MICICSSRLFFSPHKHTQSQVDFKLYKAESHYTCYSATCISLNLFWNLFMLVNRDLYSYTTQYISFFVKPVLFLSFPVKEFWFTQVYPRTRFTFRVSMLGVSRALSQDERWEVGAKSKRRALHCRQRKLTSYTEKETTEGFWAGKWHHENCH